MELVFTIFAVIIGFPIFIICLIVYAIKKHIEQQQLEEELRQKQEQKVRQAQRAKLEEQERLAKAKREEEAKQAALEAQRKESIRLFHLNTFPVTTSDVKIASIWDSKYPSSLHDNPKMIENQVRALYQTIPLLIDPEQMTALIGEYDMYDDYALKIYHTNLCGCSCYGYQDNKPCKHIYSLFYELTQKPYFYKAIIDKDNSVSAVLSKLSSKCSSGSSDPSKLSTYALTEFLSKVSSISVHADLTSDYSDYIDLGLLTVAPPTDGDYQRLLNKMTKDRIILELRKYGASGFYPSWSKFRLVTWIIENQKSFLQDRYSGYGIVSPIPILKDWIDGVQMSEQEFHYELPDKMWRFFNSL
mgnify:CR=1 FL=1